MKQNTVETFIPTSRLTLCLCCVPVGPCALEYTKLKTSDHFWTDPSANELVQRHRIHGAHRGQDTSAGRRPALGVRAEGFSIYIYIYAYIYIYIYMLP